MKNFRKFLTNTLILSIVSVIMRGIGVSFSAYITQKIGAESMGLFTLVMSVYGFATTVATSYVNLSAVRLTSERCAVLTDCDKSSWHYAMSRVVRAVTTYSLLFGLLSSAVLFGTADVIAKYLLRDMRTVVSLRVLALSLPAISLSSALSGFFTGLRKVTKNALVAVSEQMMKIVITSTALVMIAPGNVESACLAVVGGAALAEAFSLVIHFIMYVTDSKRPSDQSFGGKSVRLGTTFRDAAEISLPSAVGAYARQGLTTMEHLAIPVGMRKSGLTQSQALASYGLLQGIAFPLVMFPYAIIGSFTSLLIPEIAEQHELKDEAGIRGITGDVFRYSAIFSIGACALFCNFAGELGELIYHSGEASLYTLLLGLLVPFMYLDTAVDSILKGMGEQVYCMKVNIADSAGGLLLVMLLTPAMGIYGYILTVWICELGNLAASVYRLMKVSGASAKTLFGSYVRPVMIAAALSVAKQILPGQGANPYVIVIFAMLYILMIVLTERKQKAVRAA